MQVYGQGLVGAKEAFLHSLYVSAGAPQLGVPPQTGVEPIATTSLLDPSLIIFVSIIIASLLFVAAMYVVTVLRTRSPIPLIPQV